MRKQKIKDARTNAVIKIIHNFGLDFGPLVVSIIWLLRIAFTTGLYMSNAKHAFIPYFIRLNGKNVVGSILKTASLGTCI